MNCRKNAEINNLEVDYINAHNALNNGSAGGKHSF